MKNKKEIIREILDKKIVAIFRGIDVEKCSAAANALYDGGISLCEVTFQASEKEEGYVSTLEGIRKILAGAGERKLYVGAGTVLTAEQAELAHEAGAQFIITPNVNVEVIKRANELGMVTIPGGFTPTELELAYEAGADMVKIFPAVGAGPYFFKAVRGPLAHIPMIAVGGIDEKNGEDFLKAGAVGLGIGGNLVNKSLIRENKFDELKKLAAAYVSSIA